MTRNHLHLVNVGGPDECWEWKNYTSGYPHFDGMGAHRFVWIQEHGPVPSGAYICHTCDNKRCVNPAHLYLGNAVINSRDAWRRGLCAPHGLTGEKNSNAKLTSLDVKAIRTWLSLDHYTHGEIAKAFDVSRSTISFINQGRTWQ